MFPFKQFLCVAQKPPKPYHLNRKKVKSIDSPKVKCDMKTNVTRAFRVVSLSFSPLPLCPVVRQHTHYLYAINGVCIKNDYLYVFTFRLFCFLLVILVASSLFNSVDVFWCVLQLFGRVSLPYMRVRNVTTLTISQKSTIFVFN